MADIGYFGLWVALWLYGGYIQHKQNGIAYRYYTGSMNIERAIGIGILVVVLVFVVERLL